MTPLLRHALHALRVRLRRYPAPANTDAVQRMVSAQWQGIARRAPTYLAGYRDRPGSEDRAQRRARWVASLPVFAQAASVLEIGCACGRNLAELRRAHPALSLSGVDINPEALAVARQTVPGASVSWMDLHAAARLSRADVVFAVGVLGHLTPDRVPSVLHRMVDAAQQAVVIVDELAAGQVSEVVKGPRAWRPEHATGSYVLWRHPLSYWLRDGLNLEAVAESLPPDLRAPAAVWCLVVRPVSR